MTIRDLSRVVPYHYNSILRWVNKIPSKIGFYNAVELEGVTGIRWHIWVCGVGRQKPVTLSEIHNLDVEVWGAVHSPWPDKSKKVMTVKELLAYAPFGVAAKREFERRIENPGGRRNGRTFAAKVAEESVADYMRRRVLERSRLAVKNIAFDMNTEEGRRAAAQALEGIRGEYDGNSYNKAN